MEGKLFQAARTGDLDALYDSVREDASIFQKLHSYGCSDTPLHLASTYGHTDFVSVYMNLSSISPPQLCQLNQDGFNPLHLASSNGHVEIVKYLLEFGRQKSAAVELCMKKDRDGQTALHCAVVTGRVDVIDILVADCPEAAKKVTVHQESVLHLAVRHHQFEALTFLIEKLGSDGENLLNRGDLGGNTVLHLATARRQLQTVKYLVELPGLDVNAKNSYGLRALDMMLACALNKNDLYVEEAIRVAGAARSQREIISIEVADMANHNQSNNDHNSESRRSQDDDNKNTSFNEVRNGIIVMASIIITLSFQVALTPPGGVWQDSGSNASATRGSATPGHEPGRSIFYDLDRMKYGVVVFFNTNALLGSVVTIIVMLIIPSKFDLNDAVGGTISVIIVVLLLIVEYFSILFLTMHKLQRQAAFIVTVVFWGLFVIWAASLKQWRKWGLCASGERNSNSG